MACSSMTIRGNSFHSSDRSGISLISPASLFPVTSNIDESSNRLKRHLVAKCSTELDTRLESVDKIFNKESLRVILSCSEYMKMQALDFSLARYSKHFANLVTNFSISSPNFSP